MPAGVVVLGQVAACLSVLKVVSNRCDRRGRLIKPIRAYLAEPPQSAIPQVYWSCG
jgi:hypothetical protein